MKSLPTLTILAANGAEPAKLVIALTPCGTGAAYNHGAAEWQGRYLAQLVWTKFSSGVVDAFRTELARLDRAVDQ